MCFVVTTVRPAILSLTDNRFLPVKILEKKEASQSLTDEIATKSKFVKSEERNVISEEHMKHFKPVFNMTWVD